MKWQQAVEEVLRDAQGEFGVAVSHLESKEKAGHRQNELFQLASVFKIPILVTLMREVEAGRISLQQRVVLKAEERVPGSGVLQELDPGAHLTVKDLATLMIVVSDNYATDMLLGLIGQEKVEAHMHELGLESFSLPHNCWQLLNRCVGMEEPHPSPAAYAEYERREETGDYEILFDVTEPTPQNNVCTPEDLNRLLTSIHNREILSPASCELILAILLRQKYNSRLPLLLPERIRVAHKTGTVNNVVNDAGIIYLPQGKGTIVISVLSRKVQEIHAAERTIARLAKAVCDLALGS